jgi:hypothetical protein
MAKTSGPLFSMDASGTIGKAIVYSKWKGVNYVRQWLKPNNPQGAAQGDQRIMLGGTGRAAGKIQVGSTIDAKLALAGVIPSGQSKQSYLVKYILDHYLDNLTNYTLQLAACTGHTAYTTFGSAAAALGITEFDLAYATAAPYDKALGVFLLAKTCIALAFTGAPYTSAISAWTATQVNAFKADFTS